jgi:hypothetical protein
MYGLRMILFLAFIMCCMAQPLEAAERTYVSYDDMLILDGVNCGSLKSADGGGITAEVIPETIGPADIIKKHIGQPIYQDFTINFGFSMTKGIYEWLASSWSMSYERKNGSIVAVDSTGAVKSQRDFYNALITETTIPACDGSSKEPAYLTVKISPEYTRTPRAFTIKNSEMSRYKVEQKMWLPSNFVLEIDGLDCSKVAKIDSFTIKQTVQTDDIGDARDYMKEPGKLEFPNLRITLSESSSDSWKNWHESFVVQSNNDDLKEKKGRLLFLSPDRQKILATINFSNLGIFKLEPEKSETNDSGIKRVVAELYCERMTFEFGGTVFAGVTQSNTTPQTYSLNNAPAAQEQVLPADGKGEWGKTYSIRQGEPLYFTLQSAEYILDPVNIGNKGYSSRADEKQMLLHFTVQNPGTADRLCRYDQLIISATDESGNVHVQRQGWGFEGSKAIIQNNLAPKQQVSLYCLIPVPAKGEPLTINIKSNRTGDGPELKYDVHGHIPALQAPFADASDPNGATVLEKVQAKTQTFYPCDFFSINLENMAYTTNAIGNVTLSMGQRIFSCTMSVKNNFPDEHLLRYDTIQPVLISSNGQTLAVKGMTFENSTQAVGQALPGGEQLRVRIYFVVPDGFTPSQLQIKERNSRKYIYNVSNN